MFWASISKVLPSSFGIGLGISYLDFFLFFIGLLFLLCFFL
ncbi:putative membrane protein, partial [Acinetobacter baumannii 25691_8]